MRWMWIDRIVDFEPNARMAAVKNVSLAEEHLHDHFPADGEKPAKPIMPASLMIEGMAQTAGILVGSVNRFREKVILAKISRATFEDDVIPGQTLRYEATLDRIDNSGASTSGIVQRLDHATGQWSEIGRVDLMFSHIDRNTAGISFPEGNFVFSDNFRTILDAAGLGELVNDVEQPV
jgi:3-hydroxyacyl-[acyl-carrier-protein] dehydratase